MENNIKKKFLNLKLQIIQTLNVKEETIVVNRNIFDQVLRSIWGCSILNNYKNQNISLFTRREFSFTNNIYRNFGIKKIKYVSVKTLLITHLLRSLIFITNSFFLYLYYSMKGIDFFIKDFKVNGIEPGLLIHESYIKKFKHYVDKRTLLPKFYFFKILSAKVLINYLDDYIKKNRIKNIIIGKKEYFGLDSLFFLIAKKKELS